MRMQDAPEILSLELAGMLRADHDKRQMLPRLSI